MATRPLPHEKGWYKDAVVYQLHVRAFMDANGDGIGDFPGLIRKLDYLQDLGVTALWLLPFYPSPLKDDGYDIADYVGIHPSYGTMRDFRAFLREAHDRGMRVITELVLNHSSDQHPWFQRARRSRQGTVWRDFFVWSDTPDRYTDARIIFHDFESSNWAYDPVAGSYYWHRFYSHQPDLNFASPHVRRAMLDVLDSWLEMGVDGLRLDAVPYLFEREGTTCENLPETHGYLKELRAHIDARFSDRMLLAEANQWPEDAVSYFGDGDECHMAFHFPLMPRMFMAVRMEDRFPIIDVLDQTPSIPESAQWAVFLRNHDELTLEMVTDEERDYMYRVYAEEPQARINLGIRRRLAPLLGNDRNVIELMNGLLFSMPGTPIVYYGDEIGMGDNIYLGDRNGVRTPMQWSADRNAGFSRANPQGLYLPVIIDPEYAPEAVNVEAQQGNPNSLLWWMKRLIALRKRYRAFGRGTLQFLYPENRKILAYVRAFEDERILVVANLSRFVQYTELDLSAFRGRVPVELFGGAQLPPIGDAPYFLTMGPHAFYWFALASERIEVAAAPAALRTLRVEGSWHHVLRRGSREQLEGILPRALAGRRWFGGKGRRPKNAEIIDAVPITARGDGARPIGYIALVRMEYLEGDPDTYVLPLSAVRAAGAPEDISATALARLETGDGEMLLVDGVSDPTFASALLGAVEGRRRFHGAAGELRARRTWALDGTNGEATEPTVLGAEQSNTSVAFGHRYLMKLFRRAEQGVNPDVEVGSFLTERAGFPHTAQVAGVLEYRGDRGRTATVAVVHRFVPNEGDAWSYTVDVLRGYVAEALARVETEPPLPEKAQRVDLVEEVADPPPAVLDAVGAYLGSARLLGQRTAEMHLALSSRDDDPAFAPEPFNAFSQRATYQSMRTLGGQVMAMVRARAESLPHAAEILEAHEQMLARFRAIVDQRIGAARIRVHGDYHLGQVLYTGKDFVIIDFEGEPARPLSERRIKRSALRDVAGMIRSFAYATHAAASGAEVRPEDRVRLQPWLHAWERWVSAAFLSAYLQTAQGAPFLPTSRRELDVLLDVSILEKALYELAYEINNRPDWVPVAADGVLRTVRGSA